MLITKVIEVGINVQNCIGVYTDPENIRQILVERYEGYCIAGCLIKKIERILRLSECRITQDGSPNFGTISVIFEATAIVYAVGEIINGCVVKNKHKSGIIVCSTGIASIMLESHPMLDSITIGQIISVRVRAVKYNSSSSEIAVNAVLYVPHKESIIYKVGTLNEQGKTLLANVLERIEFEETEMKNLKKDNAKAWETFDQLLYAYKEVQPAPPGAKVLNLKEIVKSGFNGVQYLSRDPRINLSTPNVYGYIAGSVFSNDEKLRTEFPTSTVMILMLEDYCAHLRTIREMINIYSTEKLLLDHKNLWQIFKKNKF